MFQASTDRLCAHIIAQLDIITRLGLAAPIAWILAASSLLPPLPRHDAAGFR